MAYQPVEAIEVRAWDQQVGAVAMDPAIRFYVFEYHPDWLDTGLELAPLHLRTITGPHVFPNLPPGTYKRLPAMLADSLPDDFGNAVVNAALAREGIALRDITALDRLAYLGQRGIGALEYRPIRGPRTRTATAIEMSDLVVAARSALAGQLGSDDESASAFAELIAVGISAGGARAKAVVAWNPSSGELRSGQVPAPDGFEHWLLKLDGVGADLELGTSADYGRIEYGYHLMARSAGIEMADCHLLEENGRAHFMTRRFDRVDAHGETKVHLQTLCATAHLDFRQLGTHDYAQYFQTVDELDLGPDARAEAFRRMVFNVCTANCDDHTKNLSFTMSLDGRWSLSPAYDLTHAHNPTGDWTARHQMSVNGRFEGITLADIAEVADRHAVPGWRDILAQVRDASTEWPELAAKAGVLEMTAAEITADIAELAPD